MSIPARHACIFRPHSASPRSRTANGKSHRKPAKTAKKARYRYSLANRKTTLKTIQKPQCFTDNPHPLKESFTPKIVIVSDGTAAVCHVRRIWKDLHKYC